MSTTYKTLGGCVKQKRFDTPSFALLGFRFSKQLSCSAGKRYFFFFRFFHAENWKRQWLVYFCPGSSQGLNHWGLFGESG